MKRKRIRITLDNTLFELKTENKEALINFLEQHPNFGEIKTENGLITAFLRNEMKSDELNGILFINQ